MQWKCGGHPYSRPPSAAPAPARPLGLPLNGGGEGAAQGGGAPGQEGQGGGGQRPGHPLSKPDVVGDQVGDQVAGQEGQGGGGHRPGHPLKSKPASSSGDLVVRRTEQNNRSWCRQ